jgi:hypothetical protein
LGSAAWDCTGSTMAPARRRRMEVRRSIFEGDDGMY